MRSRERLLEKLLKVSYLANCFSSRLKHVQLSWKCCNTRLEGLFSDRLDSSSSPHLHRVSVHRERVVLLLSKFNHAKLISPNKLNTTPTLQHTCKVFILPGGFMYFVLCYKSFPFTQSCKTTSCISTDLTHSTRLYKAVLS